MTKKLNILIVEDELLIAEMLKEMLIELGHAVVGIAKNEKAFTAFISENDSIDLIFLDINLSDNITGVEIGEKLQNHYKISFIYLTSYSDPTTIKNAAETLPEAYLLKPFSKNDIFIAMQLVKVRKATIGKHIIIKDGHLNVKIYSKNILVIKSDRNYLEIITIDKKHVVRIAIDSFLDELNDINMVRIHRSYAVNIKKVKAINGFSILINNEKYPLSRKYKDNVLTLFSEH